MGPNVKIIVFKGPKYENPTLGDWDGRRRQSQKHRAPCSSEKAVRRKAIITSASFYCRRFNAAVCWRTSRYGRDGMQALVFRYTAWHSGSRTRKLVLGRMALLVSHQKATRFLVVLPFPSPIGFFVSAGHRIAGEEGISADHALATSRCDSAGSGRVDGLARLVGRRLGVRRASLGPVRIFRPRPCRAPSATVGRLRGSYYYYPSATGAGTGAGLNGLSTRKINTERASMRDRTGSGISA
jgi:hypothetical protein